MEGEGDGKHRCCPVPFLNTSPSLGDTPLTSPPGLGHAQGQGQGQGYGYSYGHDQEVMEGGGDRDREKGLTGHEMYSENLHSNICNPSLLFIFCLIVLFAGLCILAAVLLWTFFSTSMDNSVSSAAYTFRREVLAHTRDGIFSALEDCRKTAVLLGRLLSASADGSLSLFTTLEQKVRPMLFLTYSILLGYDAEVTYYGSNGMFLSYMGGSQNTSILFSNFTYLHHHEEEDSTGKNLTNNHPQYKWYHQPVDMNTGFPSGIASSVPSFPFWSLEFFNKTVNSHDTFQALDFVMDDSHSSVFMSTVAVPKNSPKEPVGAVGVGIGVKRVQNILGKFDLKGGEIYITTEDGRLVARTGMPFSIQGKGLQSSSSVVAGASQYLLKKYPDYKKMIHEPLEIDDLNVLGSRYTINSFPIHVSGTTLVCVLVFPNQYFWVPVKMHSHKTLGTFISLLIGIILLAFFIILHFAKGNAWEMHLRAALIQQLEATKQAESKSGHKSIVFANMSHDLRTPLAAICGLIDLCISNSTEDSEMQSNLSQMKSCATDLLGILSSILDMSKIEAGKLQLQESDFGLVKTLEQVVDTFYIDGLNKGVEVALDLSDEVVEKAYWVRGDAGRFKQVLNNLLSNSLKFTSEGHAVLRAWIQLASIEPATREGTGCEGGHCYWWSKPFLQDKEAKHCYGNDDYIEIWFEVDDTGRGIPKDRWKTVFDNFVQVEVSSVPRTYDGTGLGLGIVRSLVRMMGGDICIVDKDEPGEPGTCFRFNLVFKTSQKQASAGNKVSSPILPTSRLKTLNPLVANLDTVDDIAKLRRWDCSSISVESLRGFSSLRPALDLESVYVLLAMQGPAGKRVVRKWLERRGVRFCDVNSWEDLAFTVERIKQALSYRRSNNNSSSERLDFILPDSQGGGGVILGGALGSGHILRPPSLHRVRCPSGCISAVDIVERVYSEGGRFLVLLDVTMLPKPLNAMHLGLQKMFGGPHAELFKIIWLVSPNTPKPDLDTLNRGKVCGNLLLLRKPLQVTRLHKVWRLIRTLANGAELEEKISGEGKVDNSTYWERSLQTLRSGAMDSNDITIAGRASMSFRDQHPENRPSQGGFNKAGNNPHSLSDMHVLIAEDSIVLQKLAKTMLARQGAYVECVNNGAEAAKRVLESLSRRQNLMCEIGQDCFQDTFQARTPEENQDRPFDLVLMDCEMPGLNGYEATKRIREGERRYRVRTPVIALTAHAMAQDEKKCIEAGMDSYLTKPLALPALLSILEKIRCESHANNS